MPCELSPITWSILELLGQDDASAGLEIGGGIALWHYSPHRTTNDIDAWWLDESENARDAIDRTMATVAVNYGLELSHRRQPGYESWDLKKQGKAVFAFQVARKSGRVEAPAKTTWGHLKMESFPENLASKMNALVQRGAPRDILDVATVLKIGLASIRECWCLWKKKRPDVPTLEAQANILKYLNALDARRPLDSIADAHERAKAQESRSSIRRLATLEMEDATGL